MPFRVALTVAGSDSGGGAGIQADLKTFAAHGLWGASAVTAITAQNTRGVLAAAPVDPDLVGAQVEAVLSDLGAAAAKTGMLANAPIVEAVADAFVAYGPLPLVVDPVLVAKDGSRLLEKDALEALIERLFPLADLVTPNLPEAEAMTGRVVADPSAMEDSAAALLEAGARAVLIKGGHLPGDEVRDLFAAPGVSEWHSHPRVPGPPGHGTGCALSAAIAANLALGHGLGEAVARGRRYVERSLRSGASWDLGDAPVALLDHARGT